MKETPIIFMPELAYQVHGGWKTNTLRVITNPKWSKMSEDMFCAGLHVAKKNKINPNNSPYGQPGDLLWVKENHYAFGSWRKTEAGKRTFVFAGTEKQHRFANI